MEGGGHPFQRDQSHRVSVFAGCKIEIRITLVAQIVTFLVIGIVICSESTGTKCLTGSPFEYIGKARPANKGNCITLQHTIGSSCSG